MQASRAPIARPPARIAVGELTLDRWRPNDLEPLFAAVSDTIEQLRPWMLWAAHHELASIAQFLSESEYGWKQGDRFEFGIHGRDRVVLGSASLMSRIGAGGLEIGYWVHTAYTRQGVATRAAAALTEVALALGGVDRVEIHHDKANLASGVIAARLGFRNLGTFSEVPKAPAETGREVRWRMEKREFASSPARRLLEDARAAGRGV
jgi:ribosomal-protein-serine acetyltransferase